MFKSLLPWKRTKTKVVVQETTMEEEGKNDVIVVENLVPCPTCGRTFLPQSLRKHAPICEKTATRKRKIFDSLRQRVDGTDLAQFHQKSNFKKIHEAVTPKLSNARIPQNHNHHHHHGNSNRKSESRWEQNHLQVLNAIRTAKETAKMTELRPPTSKKSPRVVSPSQNERCPFCERNFGPKAFDRHVEWCRQHSARLHKSPVDPLAKERLEARINYKAPPLRQSKRCMVREKYASLNAGNKTKSTTSVVNDKSPTASSSSKSVRKPKSVVEFGHAKVETIVNKPKIGDKKKSEGKPAQDPLKISLRGKMSLPRGKINSIRVNESLECMIVSPIVKPKLVTWKDLSRKEPMPKIIMGDPSRDRLSSEERSVTIFYENPHMFDDDIDATSVDTISTLENPKINNLDEVFHFEVVEESVQPQISEISSFLSQEMSIISTTDSDFSVITLPLIKQPDLSEDYRKILCDSSDVDFLKEISIETDLESATDSKVSQKNVKIQASDNSLLSSSDFSESSGLPIENYEFVNINKQNESELVIEKLEDLHLDDEDIKTDDAVFYFSKSSSKTSSTISTSKVFSCLNLDFPKDYKTFKEEIDYQIPRKRLKLVDDEENSEHDLNSTFTVIEPEGRKSFLPDICVRPSHLSNISEREELKEDMSVLQLPVISGAVQAVGKLDFKTNFSKERLISKPKPIYNPFECAQRQFQELLEADDEKNCLGKSEISKIGLVPPPPITFQDFDPSEDDFETLEQLLTNIDNSNEIDKVFRKYSDDMSSIDSNLINENDNLSIPEHFKLDNYSPHSTETIRNVDNVDLYSLEYDGNIESVNQNTVKIGSGSSSSSDCAKRNLKKGPILTEILSKPPLMRSREDVNNYFQEQKTKCSDNENNQMEEPFTAEELFPVDDEMYEEYKLYEEMYLKDRDGNNCSKKKSSKGNFDYGVPMVKTTDYDDDQSPKSSKNIDSAYGSLHRNTPKSEEHKEKLTRFCHECGTKYPVDWAKFCVECGMKRLVLS